MNGMTLLVRSLVPYDTREGTDSDKFCEGTDSDKFCEGTDSDKFCEGTDSNTFQERPVEKDGGKAPSLRWGQSRGEARLCFA
jgi:hypothetical protein